MNTSIIISSCDLYSDCWLPMIKSFEVFWPDCPFQIYIISNEYEMNIENVKFIKTGEHKGFSSNLKYALSIIESDKIILFLDDFFLDYKVSNTLIYKHINFFENNSLDHLKLDCYELINVYDSNTTYNPNVITKKYAINACISLWNSSKLSSILVEGHTAWDFEKNKLSNKYNLSSYLLSKSSLASCGIKKVAPAGAICKGRWTKEGVIFLKKYNFDYLLHNRPVQGAFITFLISRYKPDSLSWLFWGGLLFLMNKFEVNF